MFVARFSVNVLRNHKRSEYKQLGRLTEVCMKMFLENTQSVLATIIFVLMVPISLMLGSLLKVKPIEMR